MNSRLSKEILDEIADYAKRFRLEESCGLVVEEGDCLRFVACKNLSRRRDMHFLINPEILIENNVFCIYHSHVNHSPSPSKLDIKSSNDLCIPYLIYSLRDDDFYFYNCV